MKGLLIKDLINLKPQLRIMGVIILLYALLSFVTKDASFFGGFIGMIVMILPITSMSYDERSKWDMFVITLPIRRPVVVAEKYFCAIALGLAGVLLNGVMIVLSGADSQEIALLTAVFFTIGVIYLSIALPILFKFGSEKARILIVALFMIPIIAVGFANEEMISAFSNLAVALSNNVFIVPLIAVLIMTGSLFLSINIYSKRVF